MKKIILASIILVFFLSFVSPCSAETKKLTVIFSGDMRGEIENCHCPKDDFGGLARRAEYIKEARKESNDLLLLDTGDVLPLSSPDTSRPSITKSAFISFKAMDMMGYDAMNVGESDLILGETFLKDKESNLSFPLVSSNILDKNTKSEFFKPYVIKTMPSGLRVGIMGLVNERYVINSNALESQANKDSAARYMEELKQKSDMIIVLGHLGIPYSIELADAVQGIGMILSGHWDSETQEPMKVNNAIIMPTFYHSRKIGRLDMEIEDGKIVSYEWQSVPMDEKYDGNKTVENLIGKMPKPAKGQGPDQIQAADNNISALQIDEIAGARPLKVLVFQSRGCRACMEVERDILPEINKKYGKDISVEYYDIGLARNYEQMTRLEKLYGVEGGYVPEVIVSRYVLMGKEKIKAGLDKVIEKALAEPVSPEKNRISKADVAEYSPPADSMILSRFNSFSVYAVSAAGLLDGINPCAFTTIVFFISFLAFCGYRKREMFLAGAFFTLAVFLTYLMIGLGLFRFFRTITAFGLLSNIINFLIAGAAFLLGALSIIDYIKFKKSGNAKSIILQLPQSIKNRIHSVIGADFRTGRGAAGKVVLARIAWVAFSAGFIVSILESLCTGQVYLPTIAYVLKMPDKSISAFLYLIIYNVAFIIPLLTVFLLGLFGVTSRSFSGFMEKRLGIVKLLTAVLFFVLGSVLIFFR